MKLVPSAIDPKRPFKRRLLLAGSSWEGVMSQFRRRQFVISAANALGLTVPSSTPTQATTALRTVLLHTARLLRGFVVLLVALSPIGTTWAQGYPRRLHALGAAEMGEAYSGCQDHSRVIEGAGGSRGSEGG